MSDEAKKDETQEVNKPYVPPRRGRHRKWRKYHPKGKCTCGHTSTQHAIKGWCKARKEKVTTTAEGKKQTVSHACGCNCFFPQVLADEKEKSRQKRMAGIRERKRRQREQAQNRAVNLRSKKQERRAARQSDKKGWKPAAPTSK